MVSAVTGFVDGFFKGRDWRDAKEDRRLDRERQQRIDQINAEKHAASMNQYKQMAGIRSSQEARAADLHGYLTNDLDFLEAERARKQRQAAEEREFWQRISGDLGATPGGGDQPSPSGRGQGNAYPIGTVVGEEPAPTQPYTEVPQPSLGYGALPDAQQSRLGYGGPTPAQQPPATIANESDADFAARVAAARERTNQLLRDTAPGSALSGDGDVASGGRGDDVAGGEGNDPIPEVDPNSSAFGQDVQTAKRSIAIQTGLSRIATRLATEGSSPIGRTFGAIKDYFGATPEEGEENKKRRAATNQAHQWFQSDDAYSYFEANPDKLEVAAQDPVGFYASVSGQETPAQDNPSDRVPSEKAQAAEIVSENPEQQQAADMSVDAAVDAANDPKVNLSLGLKPGQNVSKEQMDKGAQAYIDRYYETVVPQAVQFYVSRGEPEKAQALMDLVESRKGKAALKDIGRSTFSVLNGDYDGAAEHMLSAFKQYGYADSDMEVDLDATGIVHDDSGQPIGGKVVFRDKKSGETFEKSFATADEFIKYGHMMISPTTVAELLFEKKPEPMGAITQQDVLKAATEIMKADLTGSTTMDQAIEQAAASLGRLGVSVGGNGGGQEPPLYRLNQ